MAILSQATAQEAGKDKAKDFSKSPIVTRMMAFDKNKDGKLTKDEVTDPRLHRLFDRADANKDGVVTKEELMALASQLETEYGQDSGRGGFGGFGPSGPGPGGFGGRGGRGPRGPGRPGGFGPGPGEPAEADAPGGPGPDGPGGRGPGGFGGHRHQAKKLPTGISS
jgi:hypothetical protein